VNTYSYMVSYDVVGTTESSADYARLIERIQNYHGGEAAVLSVDPSGGSQSAAQIRDYLLVPMDTTIGYSSPG
jgi:hypothetical protein